MGILQAHLQPSFDSFPSDSSRAFTWAGGQHIDTQRQVKDYMLNEVQQWNNRDPRHVSSGHLGHLKGMCLHFRAEN